MLQILGLALFLGALLLVSRRLPRGARAATVAAGVLVPAAFAIPVLRDSPAPLDLSETAYDTSAACLRCHPDHFDTWQRSFHRSMTQEASPASVQGDFSGVEATFYGVTSRMWREGGRYLMQTVDPDWARMVQKEGFSLADLPVEQQRQRTFEVTLTIGSHNYQQYASRLESGIVARLPLAWHIGEARWVHMNGVFLQPESEYFHDSTDLWNTNCIFCHNVKARPGAPDPETMRRTKLAEWPFDSRVEEYGIACEACHGPGTEHARAHSNIARRYLRAGDDRPDPSIVNPAKLDKTRAAEVCAHCHSAHIPQADVVSERIREGDPYTAGEELGRYVSLQLPETFAEGYNRQTIESTYWPDGTNRRTSIEYMGLIASPCYQRGEMTCLSCHQLHAEDPVDQLGPRMRSNHACTQCHGEYEDDAAVTAHTHHEPGSTGSSCYNCHMPNVTWGLLRGMRTHRVITPTLDNTVTNGMPHACNQCHLDRTLGWTRDHVGAWYGEPPVALEADDQQTVASLVHLLRGDAAQRALAAWTFGWEDAREIFHTAEWAPHYLLLTMSDDYPAVRLAAFRALKTQTDTGAVEFDYLAEPEVRAAQIRALREHLDLPDAVPTLPDDGALTIGDATEIRRAPAIPDAAATRSLLARQDKTPLYVSE